MGVNQPTERGLPEWLAYGALATIGLLALRHVTTMDWMQYVQATLACFGLGALLFSRWWHRGPVGQGTRGLIALGFLFIMYRHGAPQEQGVVTTLGLTLSCVAFGAVAIRGLGRASWVDGAMLLLVALIGCSSIYQNLATGQATPWPLVLQVLTSMLLWFAVTRMVGRSTASTRTLGTIVVAALTIMAAVGILQVGTVAYHWQRGSSALDRGAMEVAGEHFAAALTRARRLALRDLSDGFAFDLASSLQQRGRRAEAAAIIGLREDLSTGVAADAWEGPEGGNLYRDVSCWKDVDLYPGLVELTVYASGTEAANEWPLMEVKLGGLLSQKLWVSSRTAEPYRFTVDVGHRGRRRLHISFLNDLFEMSPHQDRNLKVLQAEIRYQTIHWVGKNGPQQ